MCGAGAVSVGGTLIMPDLRIFIADDHEVMRQGLRTVLEARPGWKIAGEAGNGRQAVEMVRASRPDVIVMDISMPEMNGLDATREILRDAPASEILILTLHDSEQLAEDVLKAGARGYVLKSDAATDLVRAVDCLRQHAPFFTSRIASLVLERFRNSVPAGARPDDALVKLTLRERQVVQLLAEGKSNKEVAGALGISVKTAETHRSNVMHKLGFGSLPDLVRYAIRNGVAAP
jgi:DNA-binding NarL/FixJ family response regulator